MGLHVSVCVSEASVVPAHVDLPGSCIRPEALNPLWRDDHPRLEDPLQHRHVSVSDLLVKEMDAIASAEIRGLQYGDVGNMSPENPYSLVPTLGDPSSRKLFCADAGGIYLGSGLAILYLDNIRKADPSTHPIGAHSVVIEPAPPRELVIELFKTSRWMKATNPRDKIYAFLDLAKRPCYNLTQPHPWRRPLEPRYQLDLENVYLEASWYILLTEQDLGLLSCSQQEHTLNANMPSWVPDWNSPLAVNSLTTPLHEPNWTASGNSSWEAPESQLYQPTLSVKGWKVSTISAAARGKFCLSKAALIAADTPEIYPWTPGSVSRVEALWRTLVANHVDRQHPALPHHEHDFRRQWAREWDEARKSCEPSRTPVPQDARETLRRFQDAEAKLHIGFGGVEDAEQESDSTNEFGFVFRYRRTSYARTVFRTGAGHLGNGPRRLEVGDQVWVLAGASVPFVLRAQARGGYQLVGEAYVHGIMNGEALDAPDVKSEQIELV